jgi:hypothetical protein
MTQTKPTSIQVSGEVVASVDIHIETLPAPADARARGFRPVTHPFPKAEWNMLTRAVASLGQVRHILVREKSNGSRGGFIGVSLWRAK